MGYAVTLVVVLGLFMALGLCQIALPKTFTKKDLQDNPFAVTKTRNRGWLILILGIINLFLAFTVLL